LKVTKLKVTLDRKGNVLSEEIVGFEEVDREAYYRPLANALKEGFLRYEKEKERRRLQNDEVTSVEGSGKENSDLAVG